MKKNAPCERSHFFSGLPMIKRSPQKILSLFFLLIVINVAPLFAQQKTITGIVKDEKGQPMQGVNVNIQGTTTGTVTDANGRYSIQANTGATLSFTYVGFIQKDVIVGNANVVDINFERQKGDLGEVVVIGYGVAKKKDVTGAVSVVDVSKQKDVPITNVSRLLVGQAPGVRATQPTGRPGNELQVTVRGIGSLGAGSDPLYVVDGFPVGTNVGQNLNPADIESITILKDAASTAIYGARGSNGVILITTKTAKAGKTRINLDVATGAQSIPSSSRFKMMNAVEFGQFQKESFIDRFIVNNGREPSNDEIPVGIRTPENNTTSTDWFDEILNHSALFSNYNLSVASGNEKTTSLISAGYLKQDGIILKTNFERFNLRANINTKITDNIKLGLNIAGSRSNERFIPEGSRDLIVGIALWADPREPVYNPDGTFNSYLGGNGTPGDLIFGSANPVQMLYEIKNIRKINQATANTYMEFKFLKDFTFKTSFNTFLTGFRTNGFRPSTVGGDGFYNPPPRDAILSESYTEALNWSADQLLTYNKVLNDHKVDVLLGYTSQEATNRDMISQGVTFPDNDIQFLQNAKSLTTTSSETSWSLLAYFVRANYSYKDKYLLSASFRREGSSRFGSNNKWGNFPSVSIGWRISDEAPLKDVEWLNDLKLRASFGVTGNNNIGNYTALSTLRNENYIFNGNLASGRVLNSLSNINLGWEQSNQFDYGIDLTAFKNRLTFVAEYYRKTTKDMLLPVSIPTISGFETTLTNIGKVRNTGVELGIGYRAPIGNQVKFTTNFNISFNRNKVLEIDNQNDGIRSSDFYGSSNWQIVGKPIGLLYGYKNLGVFKSQQEINASPTQDGAVPGSFKYLDANGDGVVSYDTKDWVEIGNPTPDFTWALNAGLEFKGFDVNVVLTGAQNYDVYRNIESTTMNLDGVFNVETRAKDRWRPGISGNGIIPTSNYWKWERESNSFYVHDASHMWVRSISLGYTIPFKTGAFVQNARVYLNGDNMFLVTKFPNGNPEVNTSGGINPGVDNQPYPLPRTITLGAKLTF